MSYLYHAFSKIIFFSAIVSGSVAGNMSGLLQSNWHFMNLLLTTDLKQQKVLLSNLLPSQVDLITEFFFNISHVVDLNPSQQKFLKKKLSVIKILSKVKRSRKARNTSIKHFQVTIIKLLEQVKDNIFSAGQTFNKSNDVD